MRISLVPLALLRIYCGLVWLAYGTSKLEPNWAGGKSEFLSAVTYAAAQTGTPFRAFLLHFVIPNQVIFAHLIALGEILVGIALVFGALAKAGAAGGAFLSANYYLATGRYLSHGGVESIEALLFVVSVFLLFAPSSAVLSLSASLKRLSQRRS